MNKKINNNWKIQLTSSKWYTSERVSVCGYAYDSNNTLLENATLCTYFDVDDIATFQSRLQHCNGLFAVVCHSEQFCAAATDASRIYPLYYRKSIKGDITISDNPILLLQKGDILQQDALMEYHVAGYPLDGKTLVQNILQIKSGSYLNHIGEQTSYYSYIAYLNEIQHPTDNEMQTLLNNVFSRVCNSLRGRQVVVPLSGGNDSRLILCMLRRMGYENVICYTVGRPNNKEEIIAQKVAKQLGYPWYMIDTTKQEILDYVDLDNNEFQHYYHHIGGLGNFMWLFEYVAIKWMRNRKLLKDNAVFMPGHSADFNAGSQLLKASIGKNNNASYQARAIMFDHFEYSYNRKVHQLIKRYFRSKEKNGIAKWSIFQHFVFKNKLPYNINNSARVYQFFDYDVRLPYWDKAFLETFRVMPFDCLYQCNYYTQFLRENIFKTMNVDFPTPYPSTFYFHVMKLRKRIKWLLPTFLRNYLRTYTHQIDILGELLLSQSMFDELVKQKRYSAKSKFSANQIMMDWYLMKVEQLLKDL